MKIAAQLYTLRDYIQTKEDMDVTLGKVKEMGYDVVQLSGMGHVDEEKAKYIKELTDKHGLEICVSHMGFDQLTNELEDVIAYHKLWDCSYVGIGSMPEEFRNQEGYKKFAEIANGIGDRLAKENMTFVYHNHAFEYEKYDGVSGMDTLLKEFNDNVQILLDLYWVQAGGANPVTWINRWSGRIDIVHFKDMGIKNGQPYYAEVGDGNLEWDAIVEACGKAGVKYAAVERDGGEMGAFDTLAISRRNIKSMMGL